MKKKVVVNAVNEIVVYRVIESDLRPRQYRHAESFALVSCVMVSAEPSLDHFLVRLAGKLVTKPIEKERKIMIIRDFGKIGSGKAAGLYILRNNRGMSAAVTNYGAALVSLNVPDRHGKMVDVVLGYEDAAGYETGHGSLGGSIGRVANRISNATLTLNGREYQLTANEGLNTLHGGRDPYNHRLWDVRIPFTKVNSGDLMNAVASESISDGVSKQASDNLSDSQITFCLDSPDGDQGFPGNLHLEITYRLTDSGALEIIYEAESDADTPIGFTNHSYFNLNGHDSGSVLGHEAQIRADYYTATDNALIPTGALTDVSGTAMDFREFKAPGRDIDAGYDALRFGKGYDHNWCLNNGGKFAKVAQLVGDKSGITMEVYTDLPGVQVYTANFVENEPGKGGVVYDMRHGICFETQFYPDTPNHDNFPTSFFKAGEVYKTSTAYKFL
jgi:aldose 1-epimerase